MGRRHRARLAARVGAASLTLTALALVCAGTCLVLVGEPPLVRVDELWVHAHRAELRLFFPAIVVAAAATSAGVAARRRRRALAFCWGVGIVVAILFWSRLAICCRVALAQAW